MNNQKIRSSTQKPANSKPLSVFLGLIGITLIGLSIIFFWFIMLWAGDTSNISEKSIYSLIPLAFLALFGFFYVNLRKQLTPITTKSSINEWVLLLLGGSFGLFYQWTFLNKFIVNHPNKITELFLEFWHPFELVSTTLYILLFMMPFAYLGNYLARALGKKTVNLKLFLKPELIIVLFILIIYIVAPILLIK